MLPLLLALSANSPYVDARDSGLHSARSQTFTKSFPRCGIPDPFGTWAAYREYVEFLVRTNSIVEYTQVWWSIRPHFSFGTVEVRICDAQSTAQEAEALTALIVAAVAQAARDEDENVPFERPSAPADRGELLAGDPLRPRRPDDRPRPGRVSTRPRRRPSACCSGRRRSAPSSGSSRCSRPPTALSASGGRSRPASDMREVYAAAVKETRQTYVQEAKAA